jgi:thiamine phosphate synthase YjbQ (UPF0047 family)
MNERLYQPDYSCIFGERYANAFLYPQIDSLVWPIFENCERSEKLQKLLSLRNLEGYPYFYHRKLDLDDLKVELQCSNIEIAFLQALNLGREYGIENEDLINVAKNEPDLFKAILSFTLTQPNEDLIQELKKIDEIVDVVGIVLYPSYTKLDLNNPENAQFNRVLDYLRKEGLFLKIDIGNFYFPEYHSGFVSKEIIQSFISKHLDIKIIISGLDISGDLGLYYQLLNYYNNLWLELEPRCIGGMTPTKYFKNLFSIDGFIQNTWHRLVIGSASPTLESSQMCRGLLEATEDISFSQKCLLRTWVFRNAVRLNNKICEISEEKKNRYKTLLNINQANILENENEINVSYKLKLRSYSITQLIFLTNIIKDVFRAAKEKFPDYNEGNLFLKSYHTTTTLITNEHEYGNYLDLHFRFSELGRDDNSEYFHTVRALENRADFNRFDHDLATNFGNRQLILPISGGELDIGGRENYYILVTFGPRTFHLHLHVKLLK